MEDVTLVNNATMRINTSRHMWQCEAVPCTKNYSPPSGNEEYCTTASQRKTLHSRISCWFTYFAVNRVRRRLVFLPSIEYRINGEVECCHNYHNCDVLIMRTVVITISPHSLSPRSYPPCNALVISYSAVRLMRLIMLPR